MQQMQTILQHDGSNHFGLWSIRLPPALLRSGVHAQGRGLPPRPQAREPGGTCCLSLVCLHCVSCFSLHFFRVFLPFACVFSQRFAAETVPFLAVLQLLDKTGSLLKLTE